MRQIHFKNISIILLLFLGTTLGVAAQNTRYVTTTGAGSKDGSTWANASNNLQAMINASSSGDAVFVAKGTYKPTMLPRTTDTGNTLITSTDAKDVTFHLKSGVKLYGGFAGTEQTLAARDLSLATNKTTLSGDIGTANDNSDNAYHVVLSISDTEATVLDGFTITGGNANDAINYGMITVETKYIQRIHGGGMYNVSSSLSITNTTFSGNTTHIYGGGMYNNSSSPSITNTTFSGNNASSDGGGMFNTDSSSPSITNTTFSGNTANYFGGGILNSSSSPSITNTTFSGNIAKHTGGGMYNSESSSPKIYNSVFWGNKKGSNAAVAGADIENVNSSTSTIEHSLLQLAKTTANYPTTGNEKFIFAATDNNVYNQDPLFVGVSNPAGADGVFRTADDGLRLQCNSPAINVGNNAKIPANITKDITGAVRQQGGTVDMGAYESTKGTAALASNISGTTLPTAPRTYYSERTITEASIKHYCTCDNKLLLSLGTGSNVPDNGVSLKIGATPATLYSSPVGFITNPNAALINRTWNATPSTQPSSEVLVRHYFTAAEYTALNSVIPGADITVEQMKFYKATKAGAHLPVADIASNEVIMLDNGTTPSTTTWKSGAFNGDHYAEFKVASFSGGGGGGATGGSALPVELMYFQAEKDEANALLTWATASEENNKGFEVQHSTDGRTWSNIGWVDGHGNTAEVQNYKFTHDAPEAGINYYRLKQTDFDGAYEYSEVRMVSFDSKMSFIIAPNPSLAGRKNTLMLYASKAAVAEVQIYNIQGKLLLQQSIEVAAGNQRINLPTRHLSAGTYTVRLVSQRGTQSALLIKN